jgi:hypothetical protein
MKDLHEIFTTFKKDFPGINASHEAMGEQIHDQAGTLPEKVRWLIKVAISGASRHHLGPGDPHQQGPCSRCHGQGDRAHAAPLDPDRWLSDVYGSVFGIKKDGLTRTLYSTSTSA